MPGNFDVMVQLEKLHSSKNEKREKALEDIEKFKNKKTSRKKIEFMFDEYVEIAKQIASMYDVEDMEKIMETTYLKTFRAYDVMFAYGITSDIFGIGGITNHMRPAKEKSKVQRIVINPFLGEYETMDVNTSNIFLKIHDYVKSNKKGQKSTSKDGRLVLKDFVKVKPEVLEMAYKRAFEPNIGKVGKETKHLRRNQMDLPHEMLHSFSKHEKVIVKNFEDVYSGGTTNRNLHEGMTEFLNSQVILSNPKFYNLKPNEGYEVSYPGCVLYVINMFLLFPESVSKVYFGGISQRKANNRKHLLNYSIDEMMTDFENMDQNISKILEKGKNLKNMKSYQDALSNISQICFKQRAFFDELLKQGHISKADALRLEVNLYNGINYQLSQQEGRYSIYLDGTGKGIKFCVVDLQDENNPRLVNEKVCQKDEQNSKKEKMGLIAKLINKVGAKKQEINR